MRRFHKIFALFIWIFTLNILVACKSEHPNPELLDPIYSDLRKVQDEYSKAFEAEKKKIEEGRAAIEKAAPNTTDLKLARKQHGQAVEAAAKFDQLARYYAIRVERRKLEARRSYKQAFQKGEPWPDPSEYSGYLANKRLNQASRDWNKRVPKLADRIPSSLNKKDEPKK